MTNLADIRNQLLPGLMKIEGKYKGIDPEWKDIFVTKQSKMAVEKVLHTRMVGVAQVKKEGALPFADNNSGDRWLVSMETVEASIMYGMTRRAIEDGLYRTEFEPTNLGLNESMREFWNTYAANVFNTAATYDATTGGDGKALLATDHPIDGGTYGNTSATPQALNETSLLNAYTRMRSDFRNEAGLRCDVWAEKLILPTSLMAQGKRLQDAVLRPGTANNDPNVLKSLSYAAGTIKEMRFLTSPYAWFLTTNIKGLVHLQRTAYETSMWVDDFTDTLMVKNRERAGFFCTNPRAVFGQLATS